MPRGLFRIEWCLILIIIIIPVVTYIINIIININLIFFIIILLIYIITIFLWVILLLVFMTATFGSYWLINKLSKCKCKTLTLGLTNIQRSNLLPQISVSITSFSQNYCNGVVVGLLHVWLIRDIYFDNRKSPGFTKGCRSSHWVKSNFP